MTATAELGGVNGTTPAAPARDRPADATQASIPAPPVSPVWGTYAPLRDCKNNGVTPGTGRTFVPSEEGTP